MPSSLFTLFTAGLACFAPFAAAYTQPKGASPKGNPIYTPGLNDVVPAGHGYTITWKPTTPGTVTLVLLKGPSTDARPQYAIAQKIMNTGTFVWVPSTDLAPGQTGYGIQLIDDATGQYQYTTQFGISNPGYHKSENNKDSSSSSSAAASHTTDAPRIKPTLYGGNSTSNTTTPCSTTLSKTWSPLPTGSGTGLPCNSSIILPTKPMTVPSSLRVTVTATATPPPPVMPTAPANSTMRPPPSNAAGQLTVSFVGFVVAAGVAVLSL